MIIIAIENKFKFIRNKDDEINDAVNQNTLCIKFKDNKHIITDIITKIDKINIKISIIIYYIKILNYKYLLIKVY